MADFSSTAKEAAQKLTKFDADVTALQSDLATGSKDATELNSTLDSRWSELLARMESLNTKMTTATSKFEESIESLGEKYDGLDEHFTEIQAKVDTGSKALTEAAKEWTENTNLFVKGFNEASSNLKTETESVTSFVETQSGELTTANEDLVTKFGEELQEQFDTAKSTIDENGDQTKRLIDEVLLPQLETQTAELKEQFATVTTEIEAKAQETKGNVEADASTGLQTLVGVFDEVSGGALSKVEETVEALVAIGEAVDDVVTLVDAAATPVRLGANTSCVGIKAAVDIVVEIKELLD